MTRELEEARVKDRPNAPGDYTVPEIKDPKGNALAIDTKDPIFGFFTAEAHRLGLSQKQFEETMQRYIPVELARGPDWTKEAAQLGENADQRRSRVATWAQQNLGQEEFAFFSELPATAGMIKMFERIMEQTGSRPFQVNSDGSVNQENLTLAELKQMQADPKYWQEHDPQWISRVKAGFAKLAQAGRR